MLLRLAYLALTNMLTLMRLLPMGEQEKDIEILALRHQEGLSYQEIADIAQIPPGTVMSRLARARGKLKERLAARIGKQK